VDQRDGGVLGGQDLSTSAVRKRRLPGAILVAASIVAVAALLVLGRPLTFRGDEWALITERSLSDPAGWFAPHGSHLIAAPTVLYRLLVDTVGLTSYLPYLALLAVVHLAVVAGVFVAVRRNVGPWLALAAALLVLFLGAGYENLFWGFQLGYVGGIAAGLWGWLVLRTTTGRGATLAAAGLFLLAIASTLTGAVFVGIAWIDTLLAPSDRRRRAAALALPTLALTAWWIAARPTVQHFDQPLATNPLDLLTFVAAGAIHSLGALSGLGFGGGVLALAAVGVLIWGRATRPGATPAESLACIAGLIAFFGLAGASRGVLGLEAAGSSRYVYFGAVLAVLAIAPLVPPMSRPSGWRGRWMTVAAIAIFEIALLGNLRLLVSGRDALAREALVVRAEFALLDDPAARPTTSGFVFRIWTPPPPQLRELRARYGGLAQLHGGFWDPPPIPTEVLDRVRQAMATDEVESPASPIVR
jgi:hypothetical protein